MKKTSVILGAGFAAAVAILSIGGAGAGTIGDSSRDALPGSVQLQRDFGSSIETIQFRGRGGPRNFGGGGRRGGGGWGGGGDAAAAGAAIGIIGGVMGAIAAQQEEERMQREYEMDQQYQYRQRRRR